jgi:hypothetical protein
LHLGLQRSIWRQVYEPSRHFGGEALRQRLQQPAKIIGGWGTHAALP